MSDIITAATSPEAVTGLIVTATSPNSISLSWDQVAGATGYLVYRSDSTADNYVFCGTTADTFFLNDKLVSGKGYKYRVVAYVYSEAYAGAVSNIIDSSTNAAKMAIKYKQGDTKVRMTWSKINGATGYDIYIMDPEAGEILLASLPGNTTLTYTAEGLQQYQEYMFYAVARREYNGAFYDSPNSDLTSFYMVELEPTSTIGKLFPTKADFLNSWSYNNLSFFNKYVNYDRSFAIPGLINTNAGGFTSTTMCPQGLTFAKDYLLTSAYDLSGEENTVIYVLGKNTKRLLTTLVLPSKPHAGGLAFDGYNVWVTTGSRVSAIPFSDVTKAVKSGNSYVYVNYSTTVTLNITASYTTFYDNKLWVGTYNELQSTYMYSYKISDIKTIPTLTKVDTMVMPTRVQGIAFSNIGTLFMSRSCQLYAGLRGYMRQIDVYKPLYKEAVNGVIPLGNLVNSVSMPSMNEGIAINGNYLYVTFESGAFDKSTYKMDRICAFKAADIVKVKK